ncbi:MAG: hypothetical protein AABX30_03355 [Nanoarchaeota archaeon]
MEIINPSERILNSLGWNERAKKMLIYIAPSFDEAFLRGTFQTTIYIISEIYRHGFNEYISIPPDKNEFNYRNLIDLFDAWSNAFAHGDAQEKGLTYSLFIGEKGLCHGFNDGGDFFKNHEIKECFESKSLCHRKDYPSRFSGRSERGIGIRNIYGASDTSRFAYYANSLL